MFTVVIITLLIFGTIFGDFVMLLIIIKEKLNIEDEETFQSTLMALVILNHLYQNHKNKTF